MKVCIIGNGLVGLALANVLIQKEIRVDVLFNRKNKKYDKTRTLGVSKSNIDYFNQEISNIQKILWDIKNIKIYTEKTSNDEILNFNNKGKNIFSIIKNYKLYEILHNNLKKNKNVKFKKNIDYKKIVKEGYKLIINCDPLHEITNKFFSKKLEKDYNSYAYTTIIDHKKVVNNTAFQNFTNMGPIAFLPISNISTSVIYSMRGHYRKNKFDIKSLIEKFNPRYSITKINECKRFKLKSVILRKYYKDNILAFGDLIHKIHPLAGQGFNMSLRDIKLLSQLIDEKINIGLDLDSSICHKFQNSIQHKNYVFSMGIDWIYELFNFESKTNSKIISRVIKIIGKNKSINSLFKNYADSGLRV